MAKRKGNANGSQNKKHRADNDNSRQMDPLFGMYRALPVSSEVVNSLTEDTVPTDGEIYLAMVRYVIQAHNWEVSGTNTATGNKLKGAHL